MQSTALGEPAAPAGPGARIDALDALRGVAVLGIFVINIIGFSMPDQGFYNPIAVGGDGALNYGLWTFFEIFIEGSMRGLFSMMFGAGVILFTERAAFPDGPIRIADLYYRRNIWLIVFGLVHGWLLLMPGDILLIYGMASLVLFPLRILPAKTLAIAAGAILLLLTVLAALDEFDELERSEEATRIEALIETGAEITEEEQSALDQWRENTSPPTTEELEAQIAARTGDPVTVFATNAEYVATNSSADGLLWWVIDAWMMMLLGMAFYKWRIITAGRSVSFYALLVAVGYGLGLTIRIWAVSNRWAAEFSPELWLEWLPYQFARVAMTLGHIGLFFLLWKAFASSLVMRALTAAGRMALTNYIGQTVIANLIFSGIGLGLYGALDRAGVHGVMVLIWVAQLAFSMWWLARFQFGPLEWGWRCLTYGRRQRLRREKAFAVEAGSG